MSENKEVPVLDFEEMVDWIESESGYDKDIVEQILELETEWMRQAGIIIEDEV